MILRPVRPESPIGPPMVKRPVGLIRNRVFSSISSAGMDLQITLSMMAAESSSWLDFGRMLVETTTVSTRTACPPSYSRSSPDSFRPGAAKAALAPARLRKAARDAVRQRDGHGHHLGRFIAGEAEHHAPDRRRRCPYRPHRAPSSASSTPMAISGL